MSQKINLQKLFEKQMDRRQFLAHVAAGILAIVGISGLLKNLVNLSSQPRQHRVVGYGSTPYGNKKK
ncbi:MAG TPA: twin-arginine translocation signal domain-containing protein [Candidatus Saccharimonadales bacterium]|nr:twin-arginine translocation signal domain-containing protein [Candidatus Saccharimonadales bacterium]